MNRFRRSRGRMVRLVRRLAGLRTRDSSMPPETAERLFLLTPLFPNRTYIRKIWRTLRNHPDMYPSSIEVGGRKWIDSSPDPILVDMCIRNQTEFLEGKEK